MSTTVQFQVVSRKGRDAVPGILRATETEAREWAAGCAEDWTHEIVRVETTRTSLGRVQGCAPPARIPLSSAPIYWPGE